MTSNVRLPRGVIALGFVSMFMDISSEMIHSVLPIFLVSTLGVSTLAVGLIEGVAEATASIAKVFAGVASDWMQKRKPLLLLGYGMAALVKPLFALAETAATVFTARFIDRIGKGIRGAPRDALVADITPEHLRGAAYGLRQSMDTVGAFGGPALALALLALSGNDFRLVFWIAVVPAVLCVAVVVFGVSEPAMHTSGVRKTFSLRRSEIGRLGRPFWLVVAFGALLHLARFSEAFLLLRAENVGLPVTWVPAILIVMNATYAASAYPFGRFSDRGSRRGLLTAGIVLLIASDLVLASAGAVWHTFAGSVLWGLHMGASQGLLSAVIASKAPEDLRGTAFGIFNLVIGGALLLASILAGWLWSAYGPAATFAAGASVASIALLVLPLQHQ